MGQEKEWYTVDEAAEYLGVSRRTVYKMTKESQLAAYMVGKQRVRRFRKADLDRAFRPLPVLPARGEESTGRMWSDEMKMPYGQYESGEAKDAREALALMFPSSEAPLEPEALRKRLASKLQGVSVSQIIIDAR